MRNQVLGATILVVGSVCAGLFLGMPRHHAQSNPVRTEFCFLLQNLELFENRAFITSARIAVGVHGELLVDPACPDKGLSFTSRLDHGDQVNALNSKLATAFDAEVPVTFVGIVHVPSRMEKIYNRMGLRRLPKPIEITQIVSSGNVIK